MLKASSCTRVITKLSQGPQKPIISRVLSNPELELPADQLGLIFLRHMVVDAT